MTQHTQNDNTYEQIIEQPHTITFQFQNKHFLAHDEQTNWIPPTQIPTIPHLLLRHPIQQLLMYHQARILLLTRIF